MEIIKLEEVFFMIYWKLYALLHAKEIDPLMSIIRHPHGNIIKSFSTALVYHFLEFIFLYPSLRTINIFVLWEEKLRIFYQNIFLIDVKNVRKQELPWLYEIITRVLIDLLYYVFFVCLLLALATFLWNATIKHGMEIDLMILQRGIAWNNGTRFWLFH